MPSPRAVGLSCFWSSSIRLFVAAARCCWRRSCSFALVTDVPRRGPKRRYTYPRGGRGPPRQGAVAPRQHQAPASLAEGRHCDLLRGQSGHDRHHVPPPTCRSRPCPSGRCPSPGRHQAQRVSKAQNVRPTERQRHVPDPCLGRFGRLGTASRARPHPVRVSSVPLHGWSNSRYGVGEYGCWWWAPVAVTMPFECCR